MSFGGLDTGDPRRGRGIAVYGKGGGGKSTIAAALSSYFADQRHRVLHFGCDPKSDSSRLLVGSRPVHTVVDTADGTDLYDATSLLMKGIRGIACLEAGGPEPGVGCAGRGITRAFEVLEEAEVRLADYDVVMYDVLGDVVCGGFAAPLRSGHAHFAVVVVSGTGMSLFAANNIMKAVCRFQRNGVCLAGLVANYHTGDTFRARVGAFAERTGTCVLAEVPHDPDIQRAEERHQTLYDYAPESPAADAIRKLGVSLLVAERTPAPRPLSREEFERFIEAHP